MENIYNLSKTDLENYFLSIGDKKFRAVQILEWLYRKKVTSFDEMTNLSKLSLQVLKEKFVIEPLKLKDKYVSKDGTIKYLFELKDGNITDILNSKAQTLQSELDLLKNR